MQIIQLLFVLHLSVVAIIPVYACQSIRLTNSAFNNELFNVISRNGTIDEIIALIDKGANINAQDQNGSTPLSCAANSFLQNVCLALIDKGADVNAQNGDGDTPLIWAASNGLADVCLALIDKGANINAENKNGYTPLIWAAMNGHADICLALIDKGANINTQNKNCSTPLSCAAMNGLADVRLALIDKGANINAQDQNGSTPLSCAAMKGLADICIALIDKGTNIHAQDKYGDTPLIEAARKGHADACKILLRDLFLKQLLKTDTGESLSERKLRLLNAFMALKKINIFPKDIVGLILKSKPLSYDRIACMYDTYCCRFRLKECSHGITKELLCDLLGLETITMLKTALESAYMKCANNTDLKSLLNPINFDHNFDELFLNYIPLNL